MVVRVVPLQFLVCLAACASPTPSDPSDGSVADMHSADVQGLDQESADVVNMDVGSADVVVIPAAPECAPIRSATITATLDEGQAMARPTLDLAFWESGALRSVDGVPCNSDPSGTHPDSVACADHYLCGACPINLFISSGDDQQYLLNNQPDFDGGCPEYAGLYRIPYTCVPDCTGVVCGGDGCGGTCGGTCSPNEVCRDNACVCPSRCMNGTGTVCCGGSFCGGSPTDPASCVGNPCC